MKEVFPGAGQIRGGLYTIQNLGAAHLARRGEA